MKNLLVPALSWALAISHLFAQKDLPPSLAAHAANEPLPLNKLFRDAGFKIPDHVKAGQHMSRFTENSRLRLDSTVLFTNYNGNMDSMPVIRNDFSYPRPNTEVRTELVFDIAGWIPLNRNTSIFDRLDRPVEIVSEKYEPSSQSFEPDSRIEIFPRGNSPQLLDSVFAYAWDPSAAGWQRLTSIVHFYDINQRLTHIVTSLTVFGQTRQFKDVYGYDVNGDNTLITSIIVDNGFEIPTNQVVMEYEKHLVTQVTASDFNGIEFIPQSRNVLTYTPFGKEHTVTSFEWNTGNNNWEKTQTVMYTYDNQQRVIVKETRLYETGGGESREQVVFRYKEDDLVALEETYIWDGGGFFFLVDRKYYYYSGEIPSAVVTPQPVSTLQMYPNPTTSHVKLDLDETVTVHLYDHTGRMVQKHRDLSGSLILDLSQLPAGTYTIHAVTPDNTNYIGKLIKQ